MAVLVWIEQSGGAMASCWEALGKGREIANELGTSLTALVMGAETVGIAEQAQQYGADAVLTMTSPLLENYRASVFTDVLKEAIAHSDASVVLTSATIRGRELSAAAACDLGAGLAADVIDLRVEDGSVIGVRTAYSGNILVDVTFQSEQKFVSIRPRAFPIPEAGAASGSVEEMNVILSLDDIPERVTDVRAADTSEISLGDASRIVSGGRGVAQDPELGFKLVADLAKTIGAAVGASRAAVDAGYIPYKHQVGQTGKTVSPIFKRAHYGIVDDLYNVLPALTTEFEKRLS